MKSFRTTLIIVCLTISFLMQILWGNLPLSWFAFPVNVALLALFFGVLFVINRECPDHRWLKEWASSRTSVFLLFLTLWGSLFIAFSPQWQVQQSWPFLLLLMLLLSNMFLVILRYRGPHRYRFLLNHTGLLVFIAGLTFGSPDMYRLKTVLTEGETTSYAIDHDGVTHALGYDLKLEKLDASFYANGIPQSYKAVLTVLGHSHEILVNYPWHKSWKEDLYITNYGHQQVTYRPYCIIEVIVQPWKYVIYAGLILTVLGAVLLLWGKKNQTVRL